MSKLDNIVLDCINKALDGKEEKLGDYVDPTKEQLKALMLDLITDLNGDDWRKPINSDELRKKVEEL